MATNPPPEFAPQAPEPDPQQPVPWEAWQAAGIDPSYDPHQARQALGFWDALKDRNQREYAIEQLVRNDLLPEGLSLREAREILAAQSQTDPWDELAPQEPQLLGYDAQGQPVYAGQPQAQPSGIDPGALRGAVDAEIERRFQERDRAEQQRRQQEAYESEFAREIERVSGTHGFEGEEKLWLAAQANQLRQAMPYATTAQVAEEAGKAINARMTARLQALSQRQQEAPAAPLPPGAIPSDQQVPQTMEEVRAAGRQFFSR